MPNFTSKYPIVSIRTIYGTKKNLYLSVKQIIETARQHTYHAVNNVLLEAYWKIGKVIVEDEQGGNEKAAYGKETLKKLARMLTLYFGKGFDERNLNNMRAFYTAFPIWYAVRTKLSWTHYRILSRIESIEKRAYYLNESMICNWNSRQLERNIGSIFYERSLKALKKEDDIEASHFVKDPYILEFAELAGYKVPNGKKHRGCPCRPSVTIFDGAGERVCVRGQATAHRYRYLGFLYRPRFL